MYLWVVEDCHEGPVFHSDQTYGLHYKENSVDPNYLRWAPAHPGSFHILTDHSPTYEFSKYLVVLVRELVI